MNAAFVLGDFSETRSKRSTTHRPNAELAAPGETSASQGGSKVAKAAFAGADDNHFVLLLPAAPESS